MHKSMKMLWVTNNGINNIVNRH